MTSGERDDGLIGRLVPLGGRLGYGPEVFACQQGVKDTDPVEVEAVLIGGEMPEKGVQRFAGGKRPEFLLPTGYLGPNLRVGGITDCP